MDRATGAFLVAERALSEARAVAAALADTPTPGRAPVAFVVNVAGDLVVTFDDGSVIPAGRVRGDDGRDGDTIEDASVDADGNLLMRLSNGRIVNAGRVRGEAGDPGQDAPAIPGPAGRSVVAAKVNGDGHLLLTFSDSTTEDVGLVVVPGDKGDRGADGLDGQDGNAGVGVASARVSAGNLLLTMTDGTEHDAGRVVGADGKSIKGDKGDKGDAGADGTPIQISDPAPARLDASALGRVVVRELIIDGIVTRVLALD